MRGGPSSAARVVGLRQFFSALNSSQLMQISWLFSCLFFVRRFYILFHLYPFWLMVGWCVVAQALAWITNAQRSQFRQKMPLVGDS